ncbi:MAG: hypothetical protein JO169_00410 [Solirubrobacterales bacterium]|nr:hypothetical protein [Solirubrobacterales bacterium]
MSAKAIRTSDAQDACDVCGRTLLRGERAEVYVSGGARRSVCELCVPRAVHSGWVREGTLPAYENNHANLDRRRSLLGRLLARRERVEPPAGAVPSQRPEPEPERPVSRLQAVSSAAAWRARARDGEPRHVHAVPTSPEHKVASAVELFNASEHTRTVAGVARSLGLPGVVVRPSEQRASLVDVVVSWELCWYRYEVDLSDELAGVRVARQGYELDELSEEERQLNAVADEHGRLSMSG